MKLEFSPEQISVLDKALQQLPYYVAAPLIKHINAQIQQQFDCSVDANDTPSGKTTQKDKFSGD